ncbi:MAG: hypothetical protein KDD58_03440 [Bdellovibrionales bacterium]|nr:hypothetical protein [Bdellovibrionales bacterium]
MILFITLPQAFAGVFEISASANYRRSQFDEENYQESQSLTGSISYYFMQMSAIELSYTSGTSTLRATSIDNTWLEYITEFSMYGVDLVLTLAQKDSFFQPFVKIGGAHIRKDLIVKSETGAHKRSDTEPETVPSAGLGLKLMITKTFSIKLGMDAWQTKQGESSKLDYAGRAGIAWLF